jgi:hypothetical protein
MKTTKLFILVSLTGMSILLSSCYSHKKVVQSSLPYSEKINWPKGFKPAESDFFHTQRNRHQSFPPSGLGYLHQCFQMAGMV